MANSLPVIATAVGSIPFFLENRKHAIIIKPKSVEEIVNSILEISKNKKLRQNIVKNAINLVRQNTLECQSKRLIKIIKS